MSRSDSLILLVLGAVPLVGCGRAGHPEPATASESKRVVVVKPTRQSIAHAVSQPANVLALNEATLYAQVAGYLAEIAVDKGDIVARGQVLATIAVPELVAEKRQMEAACEEAAAVTSAAKVELERAESTRAAAEAGVKRAEAERELQRQLKERADGLRQDGVISPQDLEIAIGHFKEAEASLTLAQARLDEAVKAKKEASSHIDVAQAKLETAKALVARVDARIAYSRVCAPFKGIVTRRFVDAGAMIQQATSSSTQASPIVTVAAIDRVRIDFQLPEAEVAHVASQQRVTLKVDAYPGRVFEGTVKRFAGALDPATRTMLIEAEYENPGHELLPGMFGAATLELDRHDGVLTLPAEAIRTQGGERSVFVVVDGHAHRAKVAPGIDSGPIVEIVSGLKGGESVVIGGTRLTEGVAVTAIEREAQQATTEKAE